jgi:NADPH2:quinone reductase
VTQGRYIEIEEQGAPSVMQVKTVDFADPGEGEVLIHQKALGMNFLDVYHRSGAYPLEMPSGIGTEASGVVAKVGAGVTDFKEGDRVAYGGGLPGGYGDYRNMPAARVVPVPDGVTDEQAASSLMKGMTVEYLLERVYPVQSGQWVLFYAAAGGVGLIAGQWGKSLGAHMIGVAGGPEKCQLALDNGYEVCVDRHAGEDLVAKVKELTGGEGLPVVYDSIGKDTYETTLDCLGSRGMFVSFGTTSGPVPPVEAADLQKRDSLFFTRPTLVTYTAKREDLLMSAAKVCSKVADGSITVEVGQTYKLEDVVQAHEDFEAGKTTGSTLILP